MRKTVIVAVILALSFTSPLPAASAKPLNRARVQDNEMDCTKKIKYSDATRRRLDAIYQRIQKDYVDLIQTYAWAGGLTPSQKRTRLKMLQNYIDTFKKRNYQWCSEHETDEWEEEWYNAD